MSPLRIEAAGRTACRVWSGGTLLAEIRDLRLTALRLEAGGPLLIGPEVPLPLYWQQYADHENPERNASSNATVTVERQRGHGVQCGEGRDATGSTEGNAPDPAMQPAHTRGPVLPHGGEVETALSRQESKESECVVCRGTNASGAVRSTYRLTFHEVRTGVYELSVHALLEVTGAQGWLITPNPHHGELEFCNVWPVGTFSAIAGERKKYAVVAVRRSDAVTLVRHTHLESADKHRIMLREGDRIAWLLEDHNPVITLESAMPVSAGLCAYMWDVHVAYPACDGDIACVLPQGFTKEARFRLSSIPRSEGMEWLNQGRMIASPEDDRWPVYIHGLNTFRTTFGSAPGEANAHWPWTFEVVEGPEGSFCGELDQSVGFDDAASLRIESSAGGSARWMATTLGPAFGGPPFRAGKRYRLSARVRTAALDGEACIALRIHKNGEPGLYHPGEYQQYLSAVAGTGTTGWNEQAVLTPPIVPEPDRVHILLLHRGKGISWFDNVLFEEID